MGNSKSNYKRYEDDHDQVQRRRIVIERDFRLLLGQVDLNKEKKVVSSKPKQHRKLSSSSSNSTTGSISSIDLQHAYTSLVQFDIPISRLNANELDIQTLIQYLIHQQSSGKELAHLFPIPSNRKTQTKDLVNTQHIAAVYYEQTSITNDLNIERISLIDENQIEHQLEQFYSKNILSIYPSKTMAYVIYTSNVSLPNKYHLIRSKISSINELKSFEWLQPFLDYSKQGYRLCGLIPIDHPPFDTCLTIYWLFEQMETTETIPYEKCLLEYSTKSFSLSRWTALLNLMWKQHWKLVGTFHYDQKKNNAEQMYLLLFFQRLTNQQD